MLTATDSFIEFLSDELSDDPEVFWFRITDKEDHGGYLKHNALNVTYLQFTQDGSCEWLLTSLDILADDERAAMTWVATVRDLLIDVQVIPELDYAIPTVPVTTGRAVSWDGRNIRFHNVRSPRGSRYVHFNATFALLHTRQ